MNQMQTAANTGVRQIELDRNPAGIFISAIEEILQKNPSITCTDFILYLIEESHSKILLKVVPTLRNKAAANIGEISTSVKVDEHSNPFSHKAKHDIEAVKRALIKYYDFKLFSKESDTTLVFRQKPGQNGILDY